MNELREAGKRETSEERDRFWCVRKWEITAAAAPVRDIDVRREPRALARLQGALLVSLRPDEGLVFRHIRHSAGEFRYGIGLLGTRGRSFESETALAATLRELGEFFEFEKRNRWETSEEPATRWLEIQPQTIESQVPSVGFNGPSSGCENSIPLPSLIPESSQLPPLTTLVQNTGSLQAVEISVFPWRPSPVWENQLKEFRRATERVRDCSLRTTLESRMNALDSQRAWRIHCRVRCADNACKCDCLRLVGQMVFAAEVELCRANSKAHLGFANIVPSSEIPILLPKASALVSAGFKRRFNRKVPRLPRTGVVAGTVDEELLRLPLEGRQRHSYIVGSTGTGKSTLLFNLICADIRNGEGVILLDPHGGLFHRVRESIPAKRRKDLVVIDPASEDIPPSINLLSVENGPMKSFRISFVIAELLRILDELFDLRQTGGPMFEMYFRQALRLMMVSKIHPQPTLLDLPRLFNDKVFRTALLMHSNDARLAEFWEVQSAKTSGDAKLENLTPYIVSKMDGFCSSAAISQMIGQPKTTLRIGELMNRRGLLLVNLSKGLLGSGESRLLGLSMMMEIFGAALARYSIPESERVPCHLYVDEFQNFVTDGTAAMMSEARKFGLHLTLANQTLGQLRSNPGRQNILEAVLGNVGNFFAFRLGIADAQFLRPFTEPFTPEEMQRLPNFHAFARVLTEEGPTEGVIMRTCCAARRTRVRE